MGSMFARCTSLTTLDLSSFDTRNVTDMYRMFDSDRKLTTIYKGPNWSTAKAGTTTTYMFSGCGTNQLVDKP